MFKKPQGGRPRDAAHIAEALSTHTVVPNGPMEKPIDNSPNLLAGQREVKHRRATRAALPTALESLVLKDHIQLSSSGRGGCAVVQIMKCYDAETGYIPGWAQTLIDGLGSYTEIDADGETVNVLGWSTLPARDTSPHHTHGWGAHLMFSQIACLCNIQVHDMGLWRLTGNQLPGTPNELADISTKYQAAADAAWDVIVAAVTRDLPAPKHYSQMSKGHWQLVADLVGYHAEGRDLRPSARWMYHCAFPPEDNKAMNELVNRIAASDNPVYFKGLSREDQSVFEDLADEVVRYLRDTYQIPPDAE